MLYLGLMNQWPKKKATKKKIYSNIIKTGTRLGFLFFFFSKNGYIMNLFYLPILECQKIVKNY